MKSTLLAQSIRAAASLSLLAVVGVGTANAQGFLNKLKPGSEPAAAEQQATPAMTSGALVQSFVSSRSHLLEAQENFLLAFDLKDDASLLRAERDSFSAGAVDKSSLEKVESKSAEAQAKLDAKMAEEKELSAEARTFYSTGLVSLSAALLEGSRTVTAASQFASDAKSNPMGMMSSEGRSAAYVVKESPGYFSSLRKSAGMAITYGKRNKIEAPADATSMMDDMQ